LAVTIACAKGTGAAASVRRRRREPDRAILPECLARGSANFSKAECVRALKRLVG
jgi:hypothetical protein